MFVIHGFYFQSFHWNDCGLRFTCLRGALLSTYERCEVAIVTPASGQFKLQRELK